MVKFKQKTDFRSDFNVTILKMIDTSSNCTKDNSTIPKHFCWSKGSMIFCFVKCCSVRFSSRLFTLATVTRQTKPCPFSRDRGATSSKLLPRLRVPASGWYPGHPSRCLLRMWTQHAPHHRAVLCDASGGAQRSRACGASCSTGSRRGAYLSSAYGAVGTLGASKRESYTIHTDDNRLGRVITLLWYIMHL